MEDREQPLEPSLVSIGGPRTATLNHRVPSEEEGFEETSR
jgi:hypothetical protein